MNDSGIEVTLMRGGTSKGVFLRLGELPPVGPERDALALALLGSPDPMQLDGLGGTYSSTSKIMAVGTPEEARHQGFDVSDDVDVAYLFAQVAINEPVVDWRGNCGNLTAGVAVFAQQEGLVQSADPVTELKLLNLNTGVHIRSRVPTQNGRPSTTGDFVVPGVPGRGARIDLLFENPAQGLTGRLLPTGNIVDEIKSEDVAIPSTILDVTNPVVVIDAEVIGLKGSELRATLNSDKALLDRLEDIRGQAAVLCGLAKNAQAARVDTPAVPRVIIVSKPHDHVTESGDAVLASECDFVARTTSMGVIHHAFTGTGLMAAAVAALLPGSVLHEIVGPSGSEVRLAHPKGVVTVAADVRTDNSSPTVAWVSIPRTARRLMRGIAYPSSVTPSSAELSQANS